MIERIANVHRIDCGLPLPVLDSVSIPGVPKRMPAAMHGVEVEDGMVVIDPLNLPYEETHQLEAIGRPTSILITSLNHDRDALDYRRRYGARIWAHRDLADNFDFKLDATFGDGEIVPGGLQAICMPGTFRGETIFLDSCEGGSLIVGDAIFNVDLDTYGLAGQALRTIGWPHRLSTMPRFLMRDEERAMKSYEHLLSHDFARILMTHGTPVVDDARGVLQTMLAQSEPLTPFFMRRAMAKVSSSFWEAMP